MVAVFSRLRDQLLEHPIIYEFVQLLFLANYNRDILIKKLNIDNNSLIIDVGCGTSEIIQFLHSSIKYVGYDSNLNYVRKANHTHSGRGAWFVGDAGSVRVPPDGRVTFLLLALLHHLNDDACVKLIQHLDSLRRQNPHARITVIDPCVSRRQSRLWQAITRADRGQFIRTEESYVQLLKSTGLEWSIMFQRHARLSYYYGIGISKDLSV